MTRYADVAAYVVALHEAATHMSTTATILRTRALLAEPAIPAPDLRRRAAHVDGIARGLELAAAGLVDDVLSGSVR